jgi:hypothetical protein
MKYLVSIGLAVAFALSFAAPVNAGDHCAHCGSHDCEQVCRLVREDKKVNITCWGCKCEDFCAPGKSCRDGRNCEEVCDDCDAEVCTASKKFVWHNWTPGCAENIYTKKKLMKKTIEKKIPSYKWVVEDLCPHCQGKCQCAQIEPGAKIPDPPQVAARMMHGEIIEDSPQNTRQSEITPVAGSAKSSWVFKSLFGK